MIKLSSDVKTNGYLIRDINNVFLKKTLKETVREKFKIYDLHVFITAAGIAVRVIDGLPDSKAKDPAVLVADEQGKFIISLLSGHLGGANEECRYKSQVQQL